MSYLVLCATIGSMRTSDVPSVLDVDTPSARHVCLRWVDNLYYKLCMYMSYLVLSCVLPWIQWEHQTSHQSWMRTHRLQDMSVSAELAPLLTNCICTCPVLSCVLLWIQSEPQTSHQSWMWTHCLQGMSFSGELTIFITNCVCTCPILSCPVCYHEFNENLRRPSVLDADTPSARHVCLSWVGTFINKLYLHMSCLVLCATVSSMRTLDVPSVVDADTLSARHICPVLFCVTWINHAILVFSQILQLQRKQCPFDQALITQDIEDLPANYALLQLVGAEVTVEEQKIPANVVSQYMKHYAEAKACIEELALYLKPLGKLLCDVTTIECLL